jgi:D-alanyl-D-alanine carboxypeptidase
VHNSKSSALKPIDLAALQATVDATAKEILIPGAVVLLRTPQGEFAVTYGTTLLGEKSPPRPDTYFRAASNTKTMTAAVILQLAQEGKLSVDDAVSKYVQGVPNGDHITIAELLEMRSGLYNYTNAQKSRRAWTMTRPRLGPRPNYWPLHSRTHPTFRPVQPTSTTTPTTCC